MFTPQDGKEAIVQTVQIQTRRYEVHGSLEQPAIAPLQIKTAVRFSGQNFRRSEGAERVSCWRDHSLQLCM